MPLWGDLPVILKQHRLATPGELVFPNTRGNVENLANIVKRAFHPAQVAGGVVNKHGAAKYSGFHCLRHFFASVCINRQGSGGVGFEAKDVQSLLGHSSIVMTLDLYSHLFPARDHADANAVFGSFISAT